jgi:hypothetical protein
MLFERRRHTVAALGDEPILKWSINHRKMRVLAIYGSRLRYAKSSCDVTQLASMRFFRFS